MVIEVECDTLAQVDEAITARPDIILRDNMAIAMLADAMHRVRRYGIFSEASDNGSLDTVRAFAETDVDPISIGRLTHLVSVVDIWLDDKELNESAKHFPQEYRRIYLQYP